jgi:hypothetical protein
MRRYSTGPGYCSAGPWQAEGSAMKQHSNLKNLVFYHTMTDKKGRHQKQLH